MVISFFSGVLGVCVALICASLSSFSMALISGSVSFFSMPSSIFQTVSRSIISLVEKSGVGDGGGGCCRCVKLCSCCSGDIGDVVRFWNIFATAIFLRVIT